MIREQTPTPGRRIHPTPHHCPNQEERARARSVLSIAMRRIFARLLFLTAASCAPASDAPPSTVASSAVRLEPPVVLPAVTLDDVAGRPFHLREDTGGALTLLFFGYTHCPDVCPVHMANLAAVLRDLPLEISRQVDVLFVTTDPERDTPERLEEWLSALHPRFVGLRGTRAEVNALERSLSLPASVLDVGSGEQADAVGHAAQILAFGPDDTARVAYPWGTRQRDWLRDLPRLVRGDSPFDEPGAD
jgi:protein SCO1/2